MILKTNRNFICLTYKYTDYLIEKELVTGSVYFEQSSNSSISMNSIIPDKDCSIVDFDKLIFNTFSDSGVSREKMLIKIQDYYLDTKAQAFVCQIPLNEFKLFGKIMDSFLQKNGILAIRYLETGRVQYLLDINKFVKHLNPAGDIK